MTAVSVDPRGHRVATRTQQIAVPRPPRAGPKKTGRSASSQVRSMAFAALAGCILLSAVSVTVIFASRYQSSVATSRLTAAARTAENARTDMLDLRGAARDYLLTHDHRFTGNYLALRPTVRAELTRLPSLVSFDHGLQRMADQQSKIGLAWIDQYGDESARGTPESASSRWQSRSVDLFNRFVVANADLQGGLARHDGAVALQSSIILWVSLAVILVTTIFNIVLLFWSSRKTLRAIGPPLEELRRVSERLISGNKTLRADPDLGAEEIRDVARVFNTLADTNDDQKRALALELEAAEFLRSLGERIHQSLDLHDIMGMSLVPICENLGAGRGWVRAWDLQSRDPLSGVACAFPKGAPRLSSPEIVSRIVELAARAREANNCFVIRIGSPDPTDIFTSKEYDKIQRDLRATGWSSMIIVPLGVHTELLGYLILARLDGQPDWTQRDQTILHQAAQVLAQAVMHARLFRREQELVLELQELDNVKQDFVSTVSHELRTPLTSIAGHLALLRDGDLGPAPLRHQKSLATIDRNVTRLSRLIQDLLTLSRVEADSDKGSIGPSVINESTDLALLLEEVSELHEADAEKRKVTIAWSRSSDSILLQGRQHDYERALSNILGNAIKFSPPGSQVVVAAMQSGRKVAISIIDQGLGISKADQKNLFTSFFRSSNLRAHAIPGTGLGLVITRQILRNLGGDIQIDSEIDRGTTVTITCRLSEDAAISAAVDRSSRGDGAS